MSPLDRIEAPKGRLQNLRAGWQHQFGNPECFQLRLVVRDNCDQVRPHVFNPRAACRELKQLGSYTLLIDHFARLGPFRDFRFEPFDPGKFFGECHGAIGRLQTIQNVGGPANDAMQIHESTLLLPSRRHQVIQFSLLQLGNGTANLPFELNPTDGCGKVNLSRAAIPCLVS